ncbi:hypothetical protein N665_1410s0004 [Sinapis alba]|nr:hypothetical protein N665_1410s0004 [Sinapis alba]
MSEYEKKRSTRIAENRARLEALGISKAAKALLPPSNSGKEEDDDYRPGEDEIDEESEYEDEEFLSSVSRKRMNTSPPKQKKHLCRSDPLDDDLNKDLILSKMQMTADDLVFCFFHFDTGKGFITLRDVATMATVHDFTWSDEELQDMIRCFDLDKDGKLSLDEFRKVVTRCRMLNES